MEWLPFALNVVALGALILGAKYVEKRVTEAARGAVDIAVGKALAEHGQPLAKERERYSRDYGLFAQRRNEIYAETYSLLQYTKGYYAPFFAPGVTSHPDFSRMDEEEAATFLEGLELISSDERRRARDLIGFNLADAQRLIEQLHLRATLRQANRKFVDFKNSVILNSLYFDPHVEEGLQAVIKPLAELSTLADELIEDERVERSERTRPFREAEAASTSLRDLMRSEMRSGFADS